MVPSGGVFIGFMLVLSCWLAVVSFFLLRMIRHYNLLTRDISDHGLKAILEQILKREQRLEHSVESLEEMIAELKTDSAFHIQKIGIIRFNPFSDTGGSQSFTMAILDESDTGVVMTSLYARTGNRWYVKEVVKGKGKELELSREELAAITQAQSGIK